MNGRLSPARSARHSRSRPADGKPASHSCLRQSQACEFIRQRLARNVRRLREAQGLSQEAFADEAGIHRTYVSDIERGARNPTVAVVERLARALGVAAGRLLD
ncbi:MAG TPA: helix-turn-helix transcriptional regulator [Sphingomicrobium sp.]|nr:helix-turn-helix transcriptional regulator [Sphingomicrobium sp.]